ncbi:MAG TPA: alpha/beta fold hydrolase [Anaerolineae bacterium]|nr:alpha/beta fold hydrolase [Anaerolineae bacterium]
MKRFWSSLLVLLVLLAACIPAETPAPTATPPPTATPTTPPTLTPTATPTATPSPTPTATPTVTPSPTPDPYAGLTVAGLAARPYGGGELQVEETLAVTDAFTRTLVTYPSDGLTIYGFMNVPRGEGPFPVVLVLHGYIDPDVYSTLAYTTRYADSLARAGYLVIHPNLRDYPPSDTGPNSFRVGMAVDVLNLMALVREQGGQPGPLQQADPDLIGLWGHSMGGGITLRVITVDPDVRAAVLYGSMSGDEKTNYERILYWTGGERGLEELDTPDEALHRISPIFYLDHIQAAVSIHHSDADELVPLEWSLDLCERLQGLGKMVECFTYSGLPHTFRGEGDQLFMQRTAAFFDRYLKTR